MDPNANLDQQLELAKRIMRLVDPANAGRPLTADTLVECAANLAERVEALDHWLTSDGALPERWLLGRPLTDDNQIVIRKGTQNG